MDGASADARGGRKVLADSAGSYGVVMVVCCSLLVDSCAMVLRYREKVREDDGDVQA